MQARREYSSPLRADQASRTRERILAAFAEQLVDVGTTDVSIERVAKSAGVALRTVYHHFPTREVLFDAVSTWMDEKNAAFGISDIVESDDLVERIPLIFEAFDEFEMPLRAQLISGAGRAVRDRSRARRRHSIEDIVRRAALSASAEDVHRVTSLVHYLTSSEAWRSMKDESGMTGREAGESVAWAVEVLLRELSNPGGPD